MSEAQDNNGDDYWRFREKIATLIRKRDEARAKRDKARQLFGEALDVAEALAEAEARGFERGIREAAEAVRNAEFFIGDRNGTRHEAVDAILALREKGKSDE